MSALPYVIKSFFPEFFGHPQKNNQPHNHYAHFGRPNIFRGPTFVPFRRLGGSVVFVSTNGFPGSPSLSVDWAWSFTTIFEKNTSLFHPFPLDDMMTTVYVPILFHYVPICSYKSTSFQDGKNAKTKMLVFLGKLALDTVLASHPDHLSKSG